ncbi:MAG: hypothetical protein JOY78_13070, partial [Pseudonocardia sp.]|nr:hypothetical protein [Pseudonocardia sp.]
THPGPAEEVARPEHVGWMTRRRLEIVWAEVARSLGVALASAAMVRALADPAARLAGGLGPAPDDGIRVVARWIATEAMGPDSPLGQAAASVRHALARDRDGQPWWPKPRRSVEAAIDADGLVDVLVADPNGRLMAICAAAPDEGSADGAASGPVRAVLAAEAVARSLALDPDAPALLDEVLLQRATLGLVPAAGRAIVTGPRVTPVIALPAGTDSESLARIETVVRTLTDRDDADPWIDPLEVWLVSDTAEVADVLVPVRLGSGVAPGSPGTFLAEARGASAAWKATTRCLPEDARRPAPYLGRGPALPFCLPLEQSHLNLLPEARDAALARIGTDNRLWGTGGAGPGNHLLSSPVQMANALAPLVRDPDGVRAIFGPALAAADVVAFGAPAGQDESRREDVIEFGWSGPDDAMDPPATADAAFRYVTAEGRLELALVRWCYAERSLATGLPDAARARHRAAWTDPSGPFRTDRLSFDEVAAAPEGALLGLQVLAWMLEATGEIEVDRVRVVVVAPRANTEVWTELGRWAELQRRPRRFVRIDSAALVRDESPTSTDFRHRYGHLAEIRRQGPAALAAEDLVDARVAAEERLFAAAGRLRAALGPSAGDGLVDRLDRVEPSALEEMSTAAIEELAARVEELAALATRVDLP